MATVAAVQRLRFSATHLALDSGWTAAQAEEIGRRFRDAGVITQVACYTNLECAPGPARDQQLARLSHVIRLAACAGARCVVSGAGHMQPDYPDRIDVAHVDNWSAAAMDRLANSCEEAAAVAADVGITFCVEPWVLTTLNSPARLSEVVRRVGTRGFGVLLDPVNLMTLDTYFDNGRLIRACFDVLGDAIVLVHAKDTLLLEHALTYHMSETRAGEGNLDYETLLRCMDQLADPETPLIIEHLDTYQEIEAAGEYIRGFAARVGVKL